MPPILLVEDDFSYQRLLKKFLEKHGFEVEVAATKSDALRWVRERRFELVLLDYWLPDGNGLELLEELFTKNKHLPVVFLSNYTEVRIAVQAIKLGAKDYITKPVNPEELLQVVKEVCQIKSPEQQSSPTFYPGESQGFQETYALVEVVAPTELTVLLMGESGTGKEFFARKIHALSARQAAPFVAVDCGSLSLELAASELFGHVKGAFTGAITDRQGYLEEAQGGTLFLDEIGNLHPDVQAKMLRAIQERVIQKVGSQASIPLDIRIIAATNEALDIRGERNFRLDLYHRLSEFRIDVPPLRKRKEDILPYATYFIERSNRQFHKQVEGLAPETLALFQNYSWPGNLRELKNLVRRAVLMAKGPFLTPDLFPEGFHV
ncbi:sigma-54-dependent transcriptional regulator [Nitritalea halalkaliphila]|uniref:sigma-54-dependent transcriptional regulator n=1 Tax=Nitritalea halalkaliphila TaxID=590849 RepID=UPI0002E471D6|nr:sigma-54 dependent transcriptional regulator [Nitritalea halalkaliphila]